MCKYYIYVLKPYLKNKPVQIQSNNDRVKSLLMNLCFFLGKIVFGVIIPITIYTAWNIIIMILYETSAKKPSPIFFEFPSDHEHFPLNSVDIEKSSPRK